VSAKQARPCGECAVCCTYMGISDPQLKKKPLIPCPFLNKNCTIHKTKPKDCIAYNCLWAQGFGLEEDRPDKTFFIFDEYPKIKNAAQAKMIKPGQKDTPKGRALLQRWSKLLMRPIIVISYSVPRLPLEVIGRSV